MNSTLEERKLRAARSALGVSGRGLLALILWNAAKTVLSFLYSTEWKKILETATQGSASMKTAVAILLCLFLACYIAIYFYVSSHAIAEGLGRQKRSLYLVVDGLLSVILLVEIGTIFFLWRHGDATLLSLSEIPVEIITFAAAADLFVSGVRVRKYLRKMPEAEKGGAPCR